jgi:hypothetical protein
MGAMAEKATMATKTQNALKFITVPMAKKVMALWKGSLQGHTARAQGPAQRYRAALWLFFRHGRHDIFQGVVFPWSPFFVLFLPLLPWRLSGLFVLQWLPWHFSCILTWSHWSFLFAMAPIAFSMPGLQKWAKWPDQVATLLPAKRPSPHVQVSWKKHGSSNSRLVAALGDTVTARATNKKLTMIMMAKSLISLGLESDTQVDTVSSVLIMGH